MAGVSGGPQSHRPVQWITMDWRTLADRRDPPSRRPVRCVWGPDRRTTSCGLSVGRHWTAGGSRLGRAPPSALMRRQMKTSVLAIMLQARGVPEEAGLNEVREVLVVGATLCTGGVSYGQRVRRNGGRSHGDGGAVGRVYSGLWSSGPMCGPGGHAARLPVIADAVLRDAL